MLSYDRVADCRGRNGQNQRMTLRFSAQPVRVQVLLTHRHDASVKVVKDIDESEQCDHLAGAQARYSRFESPHLFRGLTSMVFLSRQTTVDERERRILQRPQATESGFHSKLLFDQIMP